MRGLEKLKLKFLIISLFFISCAGRNPLPEPKPCPEPEIIHVHLEWDEFKRWVEVSWDPNTEDDLAGYKVYYGNESGNYIRNSYVGDTTNYRVDSLSTSRDWFFAVTAFDLSGNESPFSDEVGLISVPPDTTIKDTTVTDTIKTVYLPETMNLDGYVLRDEGGRGHEIARLPESLNLGEISFNLVLDANILNFYFLNDKDGSDRFDIYRNGTPIGGFTTIGLVDEWKMYQMETSFKEGDEIRIIGTRIASGTFLRVDKLETISYKKEN